MVFPAADLEVVSPQKFVGAFFFYEGRTNLKNVFFISIPDNEKRRKKIFPIGY
jgi:hypothetical protein